MKLLSILLVLFAALVSPVSAQHLTPTPTLTVTSSAPAAAAGDVVQLTITAGIPTAERYSVSPYITLPPGVRVVAAVPSDGMCTAVRPMLACGPTATASADAVVILDLDVLPSCHTTPLTITTRAYSRRVWSEVVTTTIARASPAQPCVFLPLV